MGRVEDGATTPVTMIDRKRQLDKREFDRIITGATRFVAN